MGRILKQQPDNKFNASAQHEFMLHSSYYISASASVGDGDDALFRQTGKSAGGNR